MKDELCPDLGPCPDPNKSTDEECAEWLTAKRFRAEWEHLEANVIMPATTMTESEVAQFTNRFWKSEC